MARKTGMVTLQTGRHVTGRRRERQRRHERHPCKQADGTAVMATLRSQIAVPLVVDRATSPPAVPMALMVRDGWRMA